MAFFQTSESQKKYCCLYLECDKSFQSKYNLKRHIEEVHLKRKRFQCLECEKCYVSKQTLSDHLNSHTGEKPFQCELCGASYKHSSKFSFHMKKHKEAGEYVPSNIRAKRQRSDIELKYRKLSISNPPNLDLPPIKNHTMFNETLPLPDVLKNQ